MRRCSRIRCQQTSNWQFRPASEPRPLDSQRLGLLGSRHSPNRDREVSERHGYDTKYAMHALRIGHQGIELMEHGHITLPAPEPLRSS